MRKCFNNSISRHCVEPRNMQVLAQKKKKKIQLRRQTNIQITVPCIIFKKREIHTNDKAHSL